jgi:hypothetical protein
MCKMALQIFTRLLTTNHCCTHQLSARKLIDFILQQSTEQGNQIDNNSISILSYQ